MSSVILKRRKLQWQLELVILTLVAIGFISIFSSTYNDSFLRNLWKRQLFWMGVSGAGYIGLGHFFPNQWLRHTGIGGYIAGVISLILVLFVGVRINGAQSWFNLGFMTIQPAEFMKVALILFFAHFMAHYYQRINQPLTLLWYGIVAMVPLILILKQPDYGTVLTILPMITLLPVLAGLSKKYLISFTVITLIGAGILGPTVWQRMPQYQKDRILAFIYPERYQLSKSYNIIQARITIGSGHMFGKGFMKGTQSRNKILPAHYSDFIFSSFAEQFGFIGTVFLLLLYLYFLILLAKLTLLHRDPYCKFVISGALLLFCGHILINLAVNLGLMPATGIPLPFLSYGGSSLFTFISILGIIKNINIRMGAMIF